MPQYSDLYPLEAGGAVSAVLDSQRNTITYTITAPTGQVANLTLPQGQTPGTTDINSVRSQIRAQGGSALSIAGFGEGLRTTGFNTQRQAEAAQATATATNTAVPAAPAPPVPSIQTPAGPVPAVGENAAVAATQTVSTPSVVPTTTAIPVSPADDPVEDAFVEAEVAEPINPEEDPFEARRLELEQELDDPPPTLTAEDVGEEDPFEARRLELEQELNREELAASNFNPEPVDTNNDQALSDEEILARRNAGGLSDEEILARQPQSVPPSLAGPVGTPYDDDGNLNPGYSLDENNNPVFVGGSFVEPATAESAAASREAATKLRAKQQATFQARYKQPGNSDWRVRLSLSPNANYLYNAGTPRGSGAGILAPLANTDGVIFPYTPSISTTYTANYEQYDLVHSNYRGVFYKNSRVGDISIRGTFTAQDTTEANYLLAVIHFFRSATKMFYGQDAERGTPPPVCLLNGLGQFQFSDHPVVISSFNYTTPDDVDYIRAGNPNNYGSNLLNRRAAVASNPGGSSLAGLNRLLNALPTGLAKGAIPNTPAPSTVNQSVNNTAGATYVPTKMEIDITLIPVQTRAQVSQQFSLKGFANGDLLKGGFW